MGQILPQIEHIVVAMLENRSLDNLCGWLYPSGSPPKHVVPNGSPASYDGLNSGMWNPSNESYFHGAPASQVFVKEGAASTTVPNPDPQEAFDQITFQLFGPQGAVSNPKWPMQGFLIDYMSVGSSNPDQIMQSYSPSQVPVMSALAQNYAISDRWFCSAPCQTWPNRAFVHAGTANGNVNNGTIPDPLDWNVPTIFNVLETIGKSWSVYCDTIITPSLTRTMFMQLWDPQYDGRFLGFGEFEAACASGSLPSYSFIEPSFLIEPNDEHPPHDIAAGEKFLYQIWDAVRHSPAWNKTLLIITFDEHGGCYDHVLPPSNATPPDAAAKPGAGTFHFDRFGVRVPTILVSPFIESGTVFRASASDTATPFDHTSILATLRDWLAIPGASMLKSNRIKAAPNLASVLTLATPRTDSPVIPLPPAQSARTITPMTEPLNDLQKSLISATARRFGMDPVAVLSSIKTRADAERFFQLRRSAAAS